MGKMMRMLIKHVHSHTLAKKAKIVIQDKHSTTKEITTSMKKKNKNKKEKKKISSQNKEISSQIKTSL